MVSWIRLIFDWWKEIELNTLAWRSTASILLVILSIGTAGSFGAFAAFGYSGLTRPEEVEEIVTEKTDPIEQELTEQR